MSDAAGLLLGFVAANVAHNAIGAAVGYDWRYFFPSVATCAGIQIGVMRMFS